ncbi:MAG: gas vesicle protein GvpJ [Pseudomonadota bacterium]
MNGQVQSAIHAEGLADILERIIDKGVVIAGDVTVSLVGIELLSIKLRLLIASVDKAKELGINWWEHDPMLTAQPAIERGSDEESVLLQKLSALEERLTEAGL